MNISSIIISAHPTKMEELLVDIKQGNLCEYQLHDEKGRIIVTIEANSAEEEVEILKQLKSKPLVIDAVMSFSYSEDELNEKKEKLEMVDSIPDWLNNPNARLKDIKYNGDLKGKY